MIGFFRAARLSLTPRFSVLAGPSGKGNRFQRFPSCLALAVTTAPAGHSMLGIVGVFAYGRSVIGLLRLIGIINAGVWFGAAVFFMLGAAPAFSSADMRDLLGANNFHYFSVAIGQVMVRRYFHWYVGCSLVALIHLTGEWLYLGKYPRRGWLALIACLWLVGIAQSAWLQPRLAQWHLLQYERPAQREAYGRAFRVWHGVSLGLNCLAVLGLAVYLWRVANPPDTMHFVGASSKFRS